MPVSDQNMCGAMRHLPAAWHDAITGMVGIAARAVRTLWHSPASGGWPCLLLWFSRNALLGTVARQPHARVSTAALMDRTDTALCAAHANLATAPHWEARSASQTPAAEAQASRSLWLESAFAASCMHFTASCLPTRSQAKLMLLFTGCRWPRSYWAPLVLLHSSRAPC